MCTCARVCTVCKSFSGTNTENGKAGCGLQGRACGVRPEPRRSGAGGPGLRKQSREQGRPRRKAGLPGAGPQVQGQGGPCGSASPHLAPSGAGRTLAGGLPQKEGSLLPAARSRTTGNQRPEHQREQPAGPLGHQETPREHRAAGPGEAGDFVRAAFPPAEHLAPPSLLDAILSRASGPSAPAPAPTPASPPTGSPGPSAHRLHHTVTWPRGPCPWPAASTPQHPGLGARAGPSPAGRSSHARTSITLPFASSSEPFHVSHHLAPQSEPRPGLWIVPGAFQMVPRPPQSALNSDRKIILKV